MFGIRHYLTCDNCSIEITFDLGGVEAQEDLFRGLTDGWQQVPDDDDPDEVRDLCPNCTP